MLPINIPSPGIAVVKLAESVSPDPIRRDFVEYILVFAVVPGRYTEIDVIPGFPFAAFLSNVNVVPLLFIGARDVTEID